MQQCQCRQTLHGTAGNVFLWDRLAKAQPAAASTRFLEDFVSALPQAQKAPAAVSATRQRLPDSKPAGARRSRGRPQRAAGSVPGAARLEEVTRVVMAAVAAVVGADVATDQTLMEAGLDSLGTARSVPYVPDTSCSCVSRVSECVWHTDPCNLLRGKPAHHATNCTTIDIIRTIVEWMRHDFAPLVAIGLGNDTPSLKCMSGCLQSYLPHVPKRCAFSVHVFLSDRSTPHTSQNGMRQHAGAYASRLHEDGADWIMLAKQVLTHCKGVADGSTLPCIRVR